MSISSTSKTIPTDAPSVMEKISPSESQSSLKNGEFPDEQHIKITKSGKKFNDDNLSPDLLWMVNIERLAVIPSKWMLLALSIVVSVIESGVYYPPAKIFTILAFYALSNLVFSYVFYFHRYAAHQVKRMEYFSLATDIVVITLLIYMTGLGETGRVLNTDYYLLYFLIVLRGIVLFPTKMHTLVMNGIISIIYLFTVFFSQHNLQFVTSSEFLIRLVLLWGVMLMSWFVLEIVRFQREQIQADVNRIRRMEDQIIRSERLASMGEIAAGVAHEINNPVGIITTCTDYLLRKTKPDEPQHEHLQIIANEAERCKRIVSELLNLASPSKIKKEPVELCKLIKDSMEIILPQSKQNKVSIRLDCAETLPVIQANSTLLQRALINICSNAIQAMSEGGVLSIRSEYKTNNDTILIEITDTGKGIGQQDLDKIFTPFFSTKEGRSGLGLAITHRIIDWHGGRIKVHSQPSLGTTFEILLPIKSEPME